MDSAKLHSSFLRSTSAVSLHERFSQVLVDQLTQRRSVRVHPILLQHRRCRAPPVVLLMKQEMSRLPSVQTRDSSARVKERRTTGRSIWTRLGCRQTTQRLYTSAHRGFWSFLRKYKWRAGSAHNCRRPSDLRAALSQRRLLVRKNMQTPTAGRTQLSLHLRTGGAATSRGCGLRKDNMPTKKQLDAQLEEYMSMTKSRLDKELDDYMSLSRRRLDAQLDEYMMMAGQMQLD